MRIRRRRPAEEESLPLTPLIDVVFLLLIFFLTATSFHKKELDIKVTPPKASEGRAEAQSEETFRINIRSEEDRGLIIARGRTVDADELTDMLAEAAATNPRQSVIIRADRHAYSKRLVHVLNACRKARIRDDLVFIATQPEQR